MTTVIKKNTAILKTGKVSVIELDYEAVSLLRQVLPPLRGEWKR
jgi:hypothetical protein